VDDPEARQQAQKALRNKQKSKGLPLVAEMLAKAVKKDRDVGQMDDVSEDKSQN